MVQKINELALGYASGIVFGLSMLVLSIAGKLGIYTGAVEMMKQWHVFFDLSVLGIVLGMIEAGIISFIVAYALALVYNKLA